jgi:hypothetical protein
MNDYKPMETFHSTYKLQDKKAEPPKPKLNIEHVVVPAGLRVRSGDTMSYVPRDSIFFFETANSSGTRIASINNNLTFTSLRVNGIDTCG